MRCPNCHSVVGNNYGICQYCGYNIGEYVRNVQNNGTDPEDDLWDTRSTDYKHDYKHALESLNPSASHYENAYFYYKREYENEKEKNERYKKNMLYGALIIVLILQFLELLALVLIYIS